MWRPHDWSLLYPVCHTAYCHLILNVSYAYLGQRERRSVQPSASYPGAHCVRVGSQFAEVDVLSRVGLQIGPVVHVAVRHRHAVGRRVDLPRAGQLAWRHTVRARQGGAGGRRRNAPLSERRYIPALSAERSGGTASKITAIATAGVRSYTSLLAQKYGLVPARQLFCLWIFQK